MIDELTYINKKLIFTKQDLAQFTQSSNISSTLHNYVERGLIAKIRRNLYCACNLATKLPEADKMQIASALSGTACIGYHSALEYHGLGHQVFFTMYVQSKTRFNNVDFNGIQYYYCRQTASCGIMTPTYNNLVRATDLERTVIDCCDRIDLAGGLEELLHCLESTPAVNEKKMLDYLESFNKDVLYKKVGYIIEMAGIRMSQEFFDICQKHSQNSVSYLEDSSDSLFVKKWRLYVPDYVKQMTGGEQDELV